MRLPAERGVYAFLLRADPPRAALVLALAGLAGAAQAAAIYLIGAAAETLRAGAYPGLGRAGLLVLTLAGLGLGLRGALVQGLILAERAAGRLARRLAAAVRAAELRAVETVGEAAILGAVTRDVTTVAATTVTAVNAVVAAATVAGVTVVLLATSWSSTLIWLLFLGLVLRLAGSASPKLARAAAAAGTAEDELAVLTGHALDGFEELRLDPAKMRDLLERHARDATLRVLAERVRAGTLYLDRSGVVIVAWLGSLAAVTFVLPALGFGPAHALGAFVLALAIQPTGELIAYQPALGACAVSLRRLERLEDALRRRAEPPPPPGGAAGRPIAGFRAIELRRVTFAYADRSGETTFRVGPLDLVLRPGEIVLVAGGNGSGKSTLLKLLAGLYPPASGERRVDGRADLAPDEHRALFSAVLADHHLFRRLDHGLPDVEAARVRALLGRLGLDRKVAFADGAFSTTAALSTGQRKRLALVVAVLEDRPVLVLDEWTADQDPGFRALFYQELLPELKAEGRTVVAVTHDDRWLDTADRLVRLEDGRIVADGPPPARRP